MGGGHVDLRDVAPGALAWLRRRLRAALDHREGEEDPQRAVVVDVPRHIHVRSRGRSADHRALALGPARFDRPLSGPATRMKSALDEAARPAGIPATMLAVVFTAQDAFAVQEVPTPRPGPREVLVRVRASMVCASDAKILAGRFPATRFPHVPGHEFAGEVAASSDERFGAGARVGVEVHVGCGTCDRCREGMYTLCLNYGKRETGHAHVGFTIGGGLAEYAAVPVAALHGGRVVLGGATGTGVELSGVDLSTIVRGNLDVLGSLANPRGVSGRALALLADGKIDVTSLVTHHFPLRSFAEAWRTFTERRDGAIRVMLLPSAES